MEEMQKLINQLMDDIKKYGYIDKHGNMWIDSGLQKQRIGKTNHHK